MSVLLDKKKALISFVVTAKLICAFVFTCAKCLISPDVFFSRCKDSSLDGVDGPRKVQEPMKIIHKEQDIITAFALNQVSSLTLITFQSFR